MTETFDDEPPQPIPLHDDSSRRKCAERKELREKRKRKKKLRESR